MGSALITADFGWRRGKELLLKAEADKAMASTPSIEHCIVLQHSTAGVPLLQAANHCDEGSKKRGGWPNLDCLRREGEALAYLMRQRSLQQP